MFEALYVERIASLVVLAIILIYWFIGFVEGMPKICKPVQYSILLSIMIILNSSILEMLAGTNIDDSLNCLYLRQASVSKITCLLDDIPTCENRLYVICLLIYFSSNQNATPSLYDLSNGSIGDWFGGFLYSAGQQANEAVQDQLSALSFTSLAVIFGAGLVTSLSPCTLSVLPLTLGYIGAFGSGKSKTGAIGNSIAFALGLATTLALLGVGASFAGKAYGQIGQGLPLAASCLSIVMGLNLLEIIEIQLPSFFSNFDPRAAAANFPSSVQAYLAGLTFALAASPCSTPVLATLLAYVASSRDPIVGGSLLLTYTTGYVAPLLLAASFAGALQSLLSFRKFSAWINPMSGALLFGGGVYTMLDRLFPLTTMSMSM